MIQCSSNMTSADGNQGTGVAKWSHIVQFYEQDSYNPNFVFAPSLARDRRRRRNPNIKKKMMVQQVVQGLSHMVAACMFAKIAQDHLTTDAAVTADVISKMDSEQQYSGSEWIGLWWYGLRNPLCASLART